MQYSIRFLMSLAGCVALCISTNMLRNELRHLQVKARLLTPREELLNLQTSLPDREDYEQKIRIYEDLFEELSIPLDSTRFCPDFGGHATEPSQYFRMESICQLCTAISNDQTDAIEQILIEGVDLNYRGDGGVTALLWALACKDKIAFDSILRAGASPDLALTDHVPFRKWYVQKGSTVASLCLTQPVRLHFFEEAISYSDDVNQQSPSGDSLLMQHLRHGVTQNRKVVEAILDSGCDPNIQNKAGETACYLARSSPGICLLLIEHGADPLLGEANKQGLLDALTERRTKRGGSPLIDQLEEILGDRITVQDSSRQLPHPGAVQ